MKAEQIIVEYYMPDRQVENWQVEHFDSFEKAKKRARYLAQYPEVNQSIRVKTRRVVFTEWEEVPYAIESGQASEGTVSGDTA
jgi:hypothetical protein